MNALTLSVLAVVFSLASLTSAVNGNRIASGVNQVVVGVLVGLLVAKGRWPS